MNLTLLKSPYTASFSGNPMPFIYQVSPYGDAQKSQDISLTVRLLIEKVADSNIFEEVYIQKIYPTGDGKVAIDISTVINSYLEYYTPGAALAIPITCDAQRMRYKTKAILQNGNAQVGDEITSSILHAIKGGLADEAWHYNEFFTKIILQDKKPLLFSAAKELTDPEALKYLFWIYPFDDGAAQTITYKIYLSDGTVITHAHATTLNSPLWGVNCVPAGFISAGLDQLVSSDKYPLKYSITITIPPPLEGPGEASTIVNEYFFFLDNRNFYDKYFLLYRNSIGGMETVRLLGEVDLAADYARQQARRTQPYWFPSVNGQLTNDITEETFGYTADTGFMSKEQLLKLRDLFLSKEVYQFSPPLEGLGEAVLPVVITTSKAKFFSNKDSLVSASLEWQSAFVNNFFTPGALMPQTRACPAIEKFFASQLNKSTLQFIWSLEDPYQLIEVQVIIGSDTYTYTYKGNTGMIAQVFDNPVVDAPINITIKARTVCNPDTIPVDYGAYSTIILSVIGNSLPVAVDDYYQVPIGFNGQLPFSVLDNDYDPDGDPFEAVAEWGMFGTGSPAVYQIDDAGNVIISNASVGLTGPQTFNYHIHEIGSAENVTGVVHVNFGDGPQAIYIKIVKRNVITSGSVFDTRSTGEIWIDFFSDPACTVPINLTPYGLPVSVHFKKVYKDKNGNPPVTTETDTIYYSNGTKMKIYTGEINLYQNGGIVYNYTYYTWTVNPGIGYTPVN